MKHASPLQIQLYYFSWVIFNPCCIFGVFTEFIKKRGPAVGKARRVFTTLTHGSAPATLRLRRLVGSLWKSRAGETEAALQGRGEGASSPQPAKGCPAQPTQDEEQAGQALATQGWWEEVVPRKTPTSIKQSRTHASWSVAA